MYAVECKRCKKQFDTEFADMRLCVKCRQQKYRFMSNSGNPIIPEYERQ